MVAKITENGGVCMKCIWLGQGGLLFEFDGITVMVDPYFSDSASALGPEYKRRIAVDSRFFDEKIDILILTHNHIDHTDPETLEIILNKNQGVCVLAARHAWDFVRKYRNKNNYVMIESGTEWTQGELLFQAVHAQHSDENAIGMLISYQNKTFYITGDTLYHPKVIEDVRKLEKKIDVMFVPINGVGNNVNMVDAVRLAHGVNAKKIVPIHFGLFDDIDPTKEFICPNSVIPEFYKEIPL